MDYESMGEDVWMVVCWMCRATLDEDLWSQQISGDTRVLRNCDMLEIVDADSIGKE